MFYFIQRFSTTYIFYEHFESLHQIQLNYNDFIIR